LWIAGRWVQCLKEAAYAPADYDHFYSPAGILSFWFAYPFIKVSVKKVKCCNFFNLNAEFCILNRELNFGSNIIIREILGYTAVTINMEAQRFSITLLHL
jgi:hypothetical protein